MRVTLGLLAVILTVCSALPVSRKVRYDSYKVYRVTPRTQEELAWMEEVADRWAMLDFWKRPSKVGRPVDVMVSPAQQLSFVSSASRPGLFIETWISNVQDVIDREAAEMVSSKNDFDAAAFDYNNYHTYEEIFAWMNDFASSHPGVSMIQVTTTYEGEAVYGLRIAKSPSATNVAYIQGGIHAREWVSPATVINLIKNYIDNYGSDDTVTSMLDNFVWIIVPVYNIDGYKFSHTDDRMWRKNRNPNVGGCAGVDLNRNYDFEWGGASKQRCTQDYQGTEPLSEPENSGSKAFLQGFGSNLKLFIDFHAYGQYWLYPWGYTRRTLAQPDRDDQKALATAVENSITSIHGKDYFVGESGPDMYPATGASEDFGYGSLGVKYTYVVELRDEGTFGFSLPAYQIQPTGEEIFAGMKTLGKQLVAEYA
ncbi:carboxypeptidase B [Strongylocentrotus purpuratus]|uniref:Peptidase M14 domain-containing protein n=1 Tax=Strongylocentrotus purpuratus TaxID=7668 RepID=A0A7M7NP62_STRPU|nr:carboxypeptidase B-like [Strongylocentrotus purpuratus]XP_794118.3 carboxypeptidase B [Strongylocentrotus purpuratus]|eukprot:XP_794118.3 PREDICTED: carboxypeptidase B [Strongylocentrotus purpuratus]